MRDSRGGRQKAVGAGDEFSMRVNSSVEWSAYKVGLRGPVYRPALACVGLRYILRNGTDRARREGPCWGQHFRAISAHRVPCGSKYVLLLRLGVTREMNDVGAICASGACGSPVAVEEARER